MAKRLAQRPVRRALITGVGGQDGAYLARLLLRRGYEVWGTTRLPRGPAPWRLEALGIAGRVRLLPLDLADAGRIEALVAEVRPHEVYNLAGLSQVSRSFAEPVETGDVDALGVARLLEAEKLMGKNKFGLQDFLSQMQQLRKMGPMSKILGMLPGAGQFKQAINEIDEKEIDRIEAIIYSMTPAERAKPEILNGSRRSRIANGSGTTVQDVNGLVNRFMETRKMMRQMGKGGGLPGMPPGMGAMGGMPGLPGRPAKQQAKKAAKGKKGVSGNPAKRSGNPAAASAPEQFVPQTEAEMQQAMADFQLPPELQKMFNQQQNKGPFG